MTGDPEQFPPKDPADEPSHPDQKPGESGIPVNEPIPDEQEGGEPEPASEKDDGDNENEGDEEEDIPA
jgi:hypothetical protein